MKVVPQQTHYIVAEKKVKYLRQINAKQESLKL